jgi:outer membrane protein assembly factor BamB
VSGGVVYEASAGGTLYALSEATGAVRWSAKLSSTTSSSPAVDVGNHVVVIGDNAGIQAFSTSNGSPLWSAATTMAVVAPPVIANGMVYVGSKSSLFYGIDELTGTVAWKTKTDGAITGLATTSPGGSVGVGTANGTIYALNPSTGTVSASTPIGAPVVSITSTTGIYMMATTSGLSMWRGAGGARQAWGFSSAGGYASPAVVINGEVLAAGADGVLRTFVLPGNTVY